MVLVMKARVQYTSRAAEEGQRENTEDVCAQFLRVYVHSCVRVCGRGEEMCVSEMRCACEQASVIDVRLHISEQRDAWM